MAGNIKGIIVEVGGDTSKLQSALKEVNKVTSSLQRELKGVDSLLKVNPNNIVLLSQKQKLLKDEVSATSTKLQELVGHQKEVIFSGQKLTEEGQKNYRNLQREIIQTTNQLQNYLTQSSRLYQVGETLQKLGTSFVNVGQKIEQVGQKVSILSGAIAGIGAMGVKYNASLETYTKAFSTFLGSAEKGEGAVKEILEMSKTSPFDTKSLVQANQMLVTTGISADDSRKTISALADTIALTGGSNDTLVRMASNLQQIQNVGKASATDIRQFGYAGIDIYGLLSETTGKSVKQLKKMDITYEQLSQALQKGASEGGKYYQGQEAMANTLNGSISKLKKSFEELVGELTESVNPIIQQLADKLQGAVNWVKGLSQEQKDLITKVGMFLAVIGPAILIVGKVVGIIGLIITKVGVVISFIGKAIAVIKTIAMVIGAYVSAPILIAVGVIGGLIAVFVVLYNKCEWFRNGVKAILEAVKNFFVNTFTAIGKFFTETIPQWINTAIMVFQNLPYYIGLALGTLLGNIAQFGINVWNWVTTKLPEIINGIVNWFKQLPSRIWETLTNVINKFIEFFTNMKNKASEEGPKLVEKVKESIKQLPDRLKEIGIEAITGLFNGMKEKFENLKHKIGEFANGIKDGFKNALNIHSPSRVMRDEVGKNIALGIEEGFTRNMNMALGDMNSNLLANMGELNLAGARGGTFSLVINTQTLDDEKLEQIVAYANKKWGMSF